MGFNYQKHKNEDQHGNQWTSYSDLFMGLSFVFLLLYVTSTLRTGASGLHQQIQFQKISMENEDLKNQLKVYNSLKKDYLETQASAEEEVMYKDLMGKLDLLQEEAKTEKEKLQAAAQDNAKKEMALNKYQQMIRNIMNANVLAKSRIKKRNDIIEEQDQEISDQEAKIGGLEKTIGDKKRQIAQSESQIKEMNENLEKRMKQLKWAYKNQQLTQKKFEKAMSETKQEYSQKLSGLKDQQYQAQKQLNTYSSQLAATQKELSDKEGQVAKAEGEKRKLATQNTNLKGKLQGTEAELARALAEVEARKNVAKEIQSDFAKAGIKAEVDGETGDVTLDFGDHYFDTGQAVLKPEMANILQKVMPVYARSLMENKKIAGKINAVEIIGFASPTYKGRIVDPKSMNPEDKKAVEYNLDLSYQRARSIFQYAFDPNRMSFSHQKQIRPLVKVSGKSFFESTDIPRDIAATSSKDFCKKFDCKKSQRVLIKFTVDPK